MSDNRMDQGPDAFKLVVELIAGKGFVGGVSNSVVIASFGNVSQKVKTKFKKSTTLPVWSDHLEFPLVNTSNNSMSLNISFLERKQTIGHIKLDSSDLSKLHQVFKEVWADVVSDSALYSGQQKMPQVKLRLKIAVGACQKKPTKIPIQNVTLPKAIASKKQAGAKEKFGTTPILEYIKDGDPVGLEEHLLSNPNTPEINQKHPQNGNTPLHVVCLELKLEKREAILAILLGCEHIKVDEVNANKNTPLHYFCQHWSSPDLTCFNLFIKHGANVNAVNSNGETPLFKAIFNRPIRTLLFEALLEHNADVNVTSSQGEGVLHYAVHLGREDLVDMILQARPNLNIRGQDGYTPYQLASIVYQTEEHKKIAKHLKQVTQLFDWLEENNLSNYKGLFIKNEITLNLIPDITDGLLKQMGIDNDLERANLLKAASNYISDENKEGKQLDADEGVRRKQKNLDMIQIVSNQTNKPEFKTSNNDVTTFVKELTELRLNNKCNEDWIIDDSNLEYVKHLGTGTSGDVYKGLYEKQEVAIKVLKEMNSSQEADEFKKEFEILSAVRSPYVVWFYGASVQKRLCMVMEYCARDTLHHVLKLDIEITWEFAFSVFKDVVLGLVALHRRTPQILHRDLKSLNLLVTQDWHIKICDFGLSRFNTAENMQTLSQIRGTFAFCDPSLYIGSAYTDASDIYSLGMVFWEVTNRIFKGIYERPYSEYKSITFDFQIIIKASGEGLRPTISSNCPPILTNLITNCLNGKQELRPSLDEVSNTIDLIKNDYEKNQSSYQRDLLFIEKT